MSNRTLRIEDPRLLSGSGRYTSDNDLPNQAYAVFMRSPHAHAEILSIDTADARKMPGVLDILTGEDIKAAGYANFPALAPKGPRGTDLIVPPYPALAQGKVRFGGQPIACVIAETQAQAQDAADAVMVEFTELPCVVNGEEAMKPGAPQIHEQVPGNVAFVWGGGDVAATDAAFAKAAHVVKTKLVNQRLAVCAMEPRAIVASYDKTTGDYLIYAPSQGATAQRDGLAALTKIPKEKMRLISGDVGGGFGMKTGPYPEYLAVILATTRLGRPVKWVGQRAESFLSDNQARDMVLTGELALDKDGKFLGLRTRGVTNVGAYVSASGAMTTTTGFSYCMASVYATPAVDTEVKVVLTNTLPVGPYRGAGRPEAAYFLERLVDLAALKLNMDPIEIRRRNLIPKSAMPYKAPNGVTYDSGDFASVLDKALTMYDDKGYAARKAETEKKGRLRGRSIITYLEVGGGPPIEFGDIRFRDGRADLRLGGGSNGQGHETVFANWTAEKFGVPVDKITVIQNDSAQVPRGMVSVGSRTVNALGSVCTDIVTKVVEKGIRLAAHRLEAAPGDIEFAKGAFRVAGTDRAVPLFELANWAREAKDLPEDVKGGLDADSQVQVHATFPNGCHIAEVEIDPETGVVDIVDYICVDDCGMILDYTLAHGQIHGGIAQSVGQVLTEHAIYDPENGQLVAGSYMDYGLPRADIMPPIKADFLEVPATTNPVGAKGVGEAGTTGALPVLMGAINDALRPLGVEAVPCPATPATVWKAIQQAKARKAA